MLLQPNRPKFVAFNVHVVFWRWALKLAHVLYEPLPTVTECVCAFPPQVRAFFGRYMGFRITKISGKTPPPPKKKKHSSTAWQGLKGHARETIRIYLQ